MHIFMLNLTILLLATVFFFDAVPDLLLIRRFHAYAECFLLVLETCERIPLLYLLQTDRYKMFATTSVTFWEQVFIYVSCKEILDQVQLLTVESAVDLSNGLH